MLDGLRKPNCVFFSNPVEAWEDCERRRAAVMCGGSGVRAGAKPEMNQLLLDYLPIVVFLGIALVIAGALTN